MTRSSPFSFLLGLFFATSCLADSPAPRRVLILGDSISIGYTPIVQKMLLGEMAVLRPMRGNRAENCSGTTYGLPNIERWLAIDGGRWDVIHFNWGLHDLKHMKADGKTASESAADPPQVTVEIYEKQLRQIVAKLKTSGAQLVFATTTPVPDEPMRVYRSNADVIRYNEAALRVMKDQGVSVNDLYSLVRPRMKELQIQPANVHFTPAGSEFLAAEVAKAVRAALGR